MVDVGPKTVAHGAYKVNPNTPRPSRRRQDKRYYSAERLSPYEKNIIAKIARLATSGYDPSVIAEMTDEQIGAAYEELQGDKK
jgi:hypothetical protein